MMTIKDYAWLGGTIALVTLVLVWRHKVYESGISACRIAAAAELKSAEEDWKKKNQEARKGEEDALERLQVLTMSHPPVHAVLCKQTTGLPQGGTGSDSPSTGGSVQPGGPVYTPGPDIGGAVAVLTKSADQVVIACRRLDQQARARPN